ncbi:MAG: hypothetical protein ACRBF0_11765 [Calditrichia bacterium]
MVFSSLKAGLAKVLANKRILVTFYLANLLFAFLLMLPMRIGLGSFLGDSGAVRNLSNGLDFPLVHEFFKSNQSMFSIIIVMLAVVALVYWIVNLFLSGGAFAVFSSNAAYSRDTFWGGCGKFFGRFFRLGLLFIPVAGLLLLSDAIWAYLPKIFYGDDVPGSVEYWLSGFRVFWRGFILIIAFVIFDYSRIYTVFTDERSAWKALRRGTGFVLSNIRRTITLGFAFYLLSILLVLGYAPIADALSAPSAFIILLLFVLHQLFMLVRMIFRLALYGGETSMYERLGGDTTPAGPYIDEVKIDDFYATGADPEAPSTA